MAFRIAVAGKGGVGKTTFASLIIYHLIKAGKMPILAVDADPNSNLNVNLGMQVNDVVSDLREEVLEKKVPAGMAKTEFMELKMHECLTEGKGVDLLTMGQPEGPGCYCAINNLLRKYLSKIAKQYKYVVMDTEAGMEHLSRRTTDDIDVLFIVSEPTKVSLQSAARVKETAERIKLKIKQTIMVLNKSNQEEGIPFDESVKQVGEKGGDLLSLPEDSPAVQAVAAIMKKANIL